MLAWLLWYNRTRMHSTLNYVSPMEFEQEWQDRTGQPSPAKAGYGKAGKQRTLSNFPTASTATNFLPDMGYAF